MSIEIIRVMLIEDNPADARLIREYFSESSGSTFLVSNADTLGYGIEQLSQQLFDVILLDLSLPDSNGLETLHAMHSACPNTPIIVLTGLDDDEIALNAMRHGAQDYLLKGKFDLHLLNRAIRYTIERKRAEAEIKRLAYFDTLTGLPNRVLFADRLKQSIVIAERDNKIVAVFFLDLDHFKRINDSLGHAYGDRLLNICAERIQSCLRSSDTVARMGGDEFVVILPMLTSPDDIPRVAHKILDSIKEPACLDGYSIYTTASIGIAMYPADGITTDDLTKNADVAMYKAKEQGRNNFQFFSRDMNEQAISRQLLESSLRQALSNQEFQLYYQPQFDIESNGLIGFEALIRWNHPQNGFIPPLHFIPIAEETGMIIPIGEWVLQTACIQAKFWHDSGFPWLRIAVNISAKQFKQDNFTGFVRSVLKETGLLPEFLELELTESTIMEHADKNIMTLKALKDLGLTLAIDDFGTGYSSLSYLKHFPIDRIKIDRSFIHDLVTESDDAAIAEAIIAMAHSLKLHVIAEGVEQLEQLDFLHSRKCDGLQGFLLSHPLTCSGVAELLARTSPTR